MIYLVVDTCVWLNALEETGDENFIDLIEAWTEMGKVKIILPEVILEEWQRHREKKKNYLVEDWKKFYKRVKKHLGKEAKEEIQNFLHYDGIQKLVEKRLGKVERIFSQHSILLEITDKHKFASLELAEQMKAPFKGKNSIGDAYIYTSMIDYIERENLPDCIFISENKEDFSSPSDTNKIHPDLELPFANLNIGYYVYWVKFKEDYISRLPSIEDYQKEKEREEDEQSSRILEAAPGIEDSFIANINILDGILQSGKPTSHQVKFVLGLINSDNNYAQHFFKKVDKEVWFEILKRKGAFLPENNPLPLPVEDKFVIPFWDVLAFLEKLSIHVKEGKSLYLIDELLTFIRDVSEHPKDNYRTWYILIKILCNLPNDKISNDLLEFIPIWFKGKFGTTLQSSEISNKLLPKFLNETSTEEDIRKAEFILTHLLNIDQNIIADEDDTEVIEKGNRSRIDLYYLHDALFKKGLISKIAKYCSEKFLFYVADNLKKTRFNFPEGINIKVRSETEEYFLTANIKGTDLEVEITNKVSKAEHHIALIEKFELLNDDEIIAKITDALKLSSITLIQDSETEHSFAMLTNALRNGSYYSFNEKSIARLGAKINHTRKIENVFALIFRDILNEKVREDNQLGLTLLKRFLNDPFYRVPIFRRIAFYVISENWLAIKPLFWELVKNVDEAHYFSDDHFDHDIYELLKKNQKHLDQEEINLLENIINRGPQGRKEGKDDGHVDYWKLHWYSALNSLDPFNENYQKLSTALKVTSAHFESLGEVRIRSGSVSPFSKEEVLATDNRVLADYIQSFTTNDRWEEPTIDGLATVLGSAVEDNPERFASEIQVFLNVYYIYAYHLLNGFSNAWKKGKKFDWIAVLTFCKNYIEDSRFHAGQLAIENDGWNANSEWVEGAIASLITEGLRDSNNSMDKETLPLAKVVLKSLLVNTHSRKIDHAKSDYLTYTLNSQAGKVLMSWLHYSIRSAHEAEDTNGVRWDSEVKEVFESARNSNVLDFYVLLGWFFEYFYYLDKEWTKEQVNASFNLADEEWFAFFDSYCISTPRPDQDRYKLLYPHFERFNKSGVEHTRSHEHGFFLHLTAYYFWQFEDLSKQSLLTSFLQNADADKIEQFVNIISRQGEYYKDLTNEEEIQQFEKQILDLWKYIFSIYKERSDEAGEKVIAGLSHLLDFIPVLNLTITTLLVASCHVSEKRSETHEILENLVRLKSHGNKLKTAEYIGTILNAFQFNEFSYITDEEPIKDLVRFLYENNQKVAANEFCDKITRLGFDFLIDLRNEFN